MKTCTLFRFEINRLLGCLAIAIASGTCEAQLAQPTQVAAGANGDYAITQVGPHSRIWQNAAGQSVTEIATGMNYFDGQKWSPSDASFAVSPDGASFVASKIQDPTQLSANINTQGAVTVVTPDGVKLRSTPVAIGLYDTVSGMSVVVAAITNSTGVMADPQHIVYTNAFVGGGFTASVVYSLPDTGSFHQDVVFTGFNPGFDPTIWGFPAASTNTLQIQIFTEFYNPIQPQVQERQLYIEQDPTIRASMASPDFIDHTLDFGHYVFGSGRAYTLSNGDTPNPGVTVAKDFQTSADGRTFLIESVSYRGLSGFLAALPRPTASLSHPIHLPRAKKMLAAASIPPIHNVKQAEAEKIAPVKSAASATPRGVSVDYIATVSSLNEPKLYSSDTTYYVSGPVYETSPVTMEAAVFKYPTSAGYIEVENSLTMATTNYRTAIFTSADDNTSGAMLSTSIWSGYTGYPTSDHYGSVGLWLNTSATTIALNNLRFCYMNLAVQINADTAGQTLTLSHSQLVDCREGIYVDGGNGSNTNSATLTFDLYNCLFTSVTTPLEVGGIVLTGNAINCTVDSSTNLIDVDVGTTTTGSLKFTNSIFSTLSSKGTLGSVSLGGVSNGFYNSSSATFGTYTTTYVNPYQVTGAGNYYLTNSSQFVTNGTTNIPAALLSQLQIKTTQAPLWLTNALSGIVDLIPMVEMDTTGTALGFHYDKIDYLSSCSMENGVLQITNGVALAYYTNSGISLLSGAELVSIGMPIQRNYLVYYNLVQEQPTNMEPTNLFGSSLAQAVPVSLAPSNPQYDPVIYLRLTTIAAPTGETNLWSTSDAGPIIGEVFLQDCEVYGSGAIWQMSEATDTPLVGFTNNVFYRVPFAINNNGNIGVYNNLFYGTTNTNAFAVSITHMSGMSPNSYFNNVFDGVTATLGTNGGHNAYIHGASNTGGTQTGDTTINFPWVAGPLGYYYQPATNVSLINAGNTSATNLGLYHYTVLTNETVDGSNTVSIGYHYVTLQADGLPLTTDTNDVPDYLADANGDGAIDNGELPWYNVPQILVQPSIASYTGSSYYISNLLARGSPALGYQWLNNGSAILSANLTAYNATAAGRYTAQVSNPFGTNVSAGVEIALLPQSTQIANPGDEVLMLAPLGGTTWQWEWNGVTICGATSSNLLINYADATNAGTYTVITNGQVSSSTTLTMGPEIVIQPQDCVTPYGGSWAAFSVTAIGTPPLTYQWQLNGSNISYGTFFDVGIVNATQSDAGSYTVIVSNSICTVTSYVAHLSVTEPIISIVTSNYLVEPGTNVTFTPTILGTPGLYTYNWYKQSRFNAAGTWTNAYVGSSSNLTLSSVTGANSGVYKLWLYGPNQAVSQEINLYVDPAITNQPQNQIVDVGATNVTFSVAVGTQTPANITYQWLSNGISISGATSSNYTLPGSVTTNYGTNYSVVVSNSSLHIAVTNSPYAGNLYVRTPIWLTTNTNHASLVPTFNLATTNGNGATTNWYCVSNADSFTAILTSLIPHIVHYDAGVFQTRGSEALNANTAQPGWQHWGNTNTSGPTTIQLTCTNTDGGAIMFAEMLPARSDGFQLHDLTLDCNANGQPQREPPYNYNTGTWDAVSTCGNNIVISNVWIIHFGKQGDHEDFPFSIIPEEALDENSHLITLYSNITVENCVFTSPATGNGFSEGGLTTASILPGWGTEEGDPGSIFQLTNAVFTNCLISNVLSDFGWANGFTGISVQNCRVDGCATAIYWEVPNYPVYYGQNFSVQNNYFTNVNFGVDLQYNGGTQPYPAVGNIQINSNVIVLTNNYAYLFGANWGAAVSLGAPSSLGAVPQIPSLTAQYNQIITGGGKQWWGFALGNISNAIVSYNSLDTSDYGIMDNTRILRQADDPIWQTLPISYLVANHNTNGTQLVPITPWSDASTVPAVGTQVKGDFVLNGNADLLWHNTVTGQNMLWPMNGTSTVSCGGTLLSNGIASLGGGWALTGTGDFTGDCNNDILWSMTTTTYGYEALLWTMQGESLIATNFLEFGGGLSGYGFAATGDFTADGMTDVVLTNSGTSSFWIYEVNGTSQTIVEWGGPSVTYISEVSGITWPGTGPQIVGAGPFNGGEQSDILFRDSLGNNYVWIMTGDTFNNLPANKITLSQESDMNWKIVGVGDFNGDGVADIVWRNSSTGANRIWLTSNPLSTNYTNVTLPSLADTNWTIGGPK